MRNPIIVITGPTASGKTKLAVELAKKFGGEVVNADSRTVYKEMDVATSKPTKDEMANIPHHLFDIIRPDETFTLADYKKLAETAIAEIHSREKIPFLVGGTGLYIDALVYDFEPAGEPNPELRKELEKRDPELLYAMLLNFDPETARTIDPKNTRRVIRALEIYEQTKEGKTKLEKQKPKPENVLYLAIDGDRERLYEKINQRIEEWAKDNKLVDETKKLKEKYSLDLPAMSSIGYKEIAEALNGEITLQGALEKMKRRTRNYAKRQLTWFRRNKDIIWIKNHKEAEAKISDFLKS